MNIAILKQYQRDLKTLGYDPGPIDGVWGPHTAAAALGLARELRYLDKYLKSLDASTMANLLVFLRKGQEQPCRWGVDVASYQDRRKIDYHRAWDDGCEFVIVKASQGFNEDPAYREHVKLIRDTPIHLGYYHYASFATKSRRSLQGAMDQAQTFCEVVGEIKPGDVIPWLDVESWVVKLMSRAQITEWVLTWLRHVEKLLGVRGGVYTLASYAKYQLTDDPELASHPLWLAGAGGPKLSKTEVPLSSQCTLASPTPWPSYALYQWTVGRVPWYKEGKGKIDRDALLVPLEDLLVK